MLCKKGQVEMETILAVVFSLAILLMVIVYTQQQQQDIKAMEKLDREKNECKKISSFISLMSSSESSDSIVIESELGATIIGNTVIVGNHYCTFSGQAQGTVASGKIKIFEENGVVRVGNV